MVRKGVNANYRKLQRLWWVVLSAVLFLAAGCSPTPQLAAPTASPPPDRESLIPPEQARVLPETDVYPPKSLSAEYADPEPLPYPVNTAGAEDSAFMMPDGQTLYVWFTPSPGIPVEQQVLDGVTGIYVFQRLDDGWSPAERVLLQDPGKLSLDGCEFVQGDTIWFCAAREGYTGLHWFTAKYLDGRWGNWQEAGFKLDYEVGELHISADGKELYFHSARPGGMGEYDIWVSERVNGEWGTPVNLAVVNTPDSDGWPYLSPDGSELWITRTQGAPELWRSQRVDGSWTEPERIFAPFAGEASMDGAGNVYFTHHFYKDNVMLEADIYVAYRIAP